MRDTDYTVEWKVSPASPSKRTCSVCSKALSKYNRLGYCFRHPDPEKERLRLGREARLQATELARTLPIVRKMREAPLAGVPVSQGRDESLIAEEVIAAVSDLFKVNRMAIIAAGRQADAVRARHIAMYLLRTDLSF